MIKAGSVRAEGNVKHFTTLNSGAAADRRYALSGNTGKVAGWNDGSFPVYFAVGDSSVDCTGESSSDGFLAPDDFVPCGVVLDCSEGQYISLYSASDSPTVYLFEVA